MATTESLLSLIPTADILDALMRRYPTMVFGSESQDDDEDWIFYAGEPRDVAYLLDRVQWTFMCETQGTEIEEQELDPDEEDD